MVWYLWKEISENKFQTFGLPGGEKTIKIEAGLPGVSTGVCMNDEAGKSGIQRAFIACHGHWGKEKLVLPARAREGNEVSKLIH